MRVLNLQHPEMSAWSPLDQLLNLREEIHRLFEPPHADGQRTTEFSMAGRQPLICTKTRKTCSSKLSFPD